jgi:hypothetical protein
MQWLTVRFLLLAVLVGIGSGAWAAERVCYLYDDLPSYPWSGVMGAGVVVEHRCADAPASGVYCTRVTFDGSDDWAGVYIQNRDANWWGPGLDWSGAARLTFRFRGEPEGESVEFRAFNDQAAGYSALLSSQWQTMEIPAPADPSDLWNLFGAFVVGQVARTVDLDQIAIHFERPAESAVPVAITGSGAPLWDYGLSVGGSPFELRGVGYNATDPGSRNEEDFALMAESGINTLRFWGQADVTPALLDRADAAGMKVIVAFWLPRGDETPGGALYTDPLLWQATRTAALNFVACYKDHPAVLMWSMGNEVFLNLTPDTEENRGAVTALVDSIAVDIVEVDPHHPVTYASAADAAFPYLCDTHIDLMGTNVYQMLPEVLAQYRLSGCEKPLIVLEYGCDGWWERDWSRYSDLERARDYGERAMRLEEERGLTVGGCAFAWVDKSEGGDPAYTGWGLVDGDSAPRFQLRALGSVYLSSEVGDANLRIHTNATQFCPADSIGVWSLIANSTAAVRNADLLNAIQWRDGFFFYPEWAFSNSGWDAEAVLLQPYAFEIRRTLAARFEESLQVNEPSNAAGGLTEPGVIDWIGGRERGLQVIPLHFGGCGSEW